MKAFGDFFVFVFFFKMCMNYIRVETNVGKFLDFNKFRSRFKASKPNVSIFFGNAIGTNRRTSLSSKLN